MKIIYQVGDKSGEITWAASEYFGKLAGQEFSLGELEATSINEIQDLSGAAKLLLSAVAGAVIQHLLDTGMDATEIFKNGTVRFEDA